MDKPNDYSGLQLVGAIRKLQSKDAAIEQLKFEVADQAAEIARLKNAPVAEKLARLDEFQK